MLDLTLHLVTAEESAYVYFLLFLKCVPQQDDPLNMFFIKLHTSTKICIRATVL